MSRKFQNKKLDLVSLDVVSADKVWNKNSRRKGKPTLNKNYDYFGRIDKGVSSFITRTNSTGDNFKFVEDANKLPKNAKNKVVDMFCNKNKRVVYLVKKKK